MLYPGDDGVKLAGSGNDCCTLGVVAARMAASNSAKCAIKAIDDNDINYLTFLETVEWVGSETYDGRGMILVRALILLA